MFRLSCTPKCVLPTRVWLGLRARPWSSVRWCSRAPSRRSCRPMLTQNWDKTALALNEADRSLAPVCREDFKCLWGTLIIMVATSKSLTAFNRTNRVVSRHFRLISWVKGRRRVRKTWNYFKHSPRRFHLQLVVKTTKYWLTCAVSLMPTETR